MQHSDSYLRHFERVLPIVGPALRQRRVAVLGLSEAARTVEHLAACGVRRWCWEAGRPADELSGRLADRHGAALDLDALAVAHARWPLAARRGVPDLLLAFGRPLRLLRAYQAARAHARPALLAARAGAAGWRALHVLPGDDPRTVLGWIASMSAHSMIPDAPALQDWDLVTVSPLLAGFARALLLRATPYARADLEQLWSAGLRQVAIGGRDPLAVAWTSGAVARPPEAAPFSAPPVRRGRVLVVGLGSIGSVAAALLAPAAEQLILADPDLVDAANPARQAYGWRSVGRPKAAALAAALAGPGLATHAVPEALASEQAVAALVRRYGITAALVATGTDADFAVARALRASGLPHVVARCYPRARYWEAIMVDGSAGPALGDIRGRLAPGPHAAPTPEQIAAYSDAGALEAEPATLVESGWAAAWAARLTAQLAAPPGLRERWALELLVARQTCLVGGVGVEATPHGPAYGVELPGQIHAWGPASIAGSSMPGAAAL